MFDSLKKLTRASAISVKTVVISAGVLSVLTGAAVLTARTSDATIKQESLMLKENADGTPALTQTYDAAELAIGADDGQSEKQAENAAPVPPELIPDSLITAQIGVGEPLSVVLRKKGVPAGEIYKITEALSDVLNLKQIQIGDTVQIGKMNMADGAESVLFVTLENRHGFKYTAMRSEADSFESSLTEPQVDVQMEYAQGEIAGNFLNSAKEAGIPTNVAQQIIWAFDGPVDFQRDLRKGDKFLAVFQKEYNMQGNPTGNGSLIYASFDLKVGKHERILYKDSNGAEDYYDESGKIARRLLSMHPLERPRVTSSYGQRKHPILKYTITHWGTDYGAPIGTPIRAPGDAVVTYMGTRGGYGKYIQLKHNSEYSTAYGHMSRFNDSLKVGQRIKAGRIIGYVGNTGRSTGPHLHWELIKNGKKINPTLHKITASRKLRGRELEKFNQHTASLKNDLLSSPVLVKAQPLPEDRKLAYRPEKKVKKVVRKKAARKQKTAARRTATKTR